MSHARRTHRTPSFAGTGRSRVADSRTTHANGDKAVLRRLDILDERIWAAARTTDDPHLAVRTARDFADGVFLGIVVGAGSGQHRLTCSVATETGVLTAPASMPMSVMAEVRAVALPEDRADNEICELVALAYASDSPAVVVLKSTDLDGPPFEHADEFTIRGWRITGQRCEPIDAAGIFAVCCSDSIGNEPLPIHPGTRYEDAYPLIRIPRPGPDDDD
jgi:hypothetical protein